MTNPKPLPGYYCWIKLVDILDLPIHIEGTGKPPKKKAYVPHLDILEIGHRSACFHIGTDAHKLGTNEVFDIGPAFSSEPEAESWSRNTKEGQDWISGSKNCVLVGFSFDIPKDVGQPASSKTVVFRESDLSAEVGFPYDDWDAELRAEFFNRGASKILFFGHEIELLPPEHFATGNECEAVLSVSRGRTVDREKEIIGQALSDEDLIFHAITKPLSEAGAQGDPEQARRVARYAFDVIWKPTYVFKAHFNRARPWNCCGPTLEPLFRKGHHLYPGHPSYPSGHSTQAHTLAYLFAKRYPDLKQTLLDVADRIARNREIAGVHFPTDSAAGQWLGERFADAVVNAPSQYQDADWVDFMNDLSALGDG